MSRRVNLIGICGASCLCVLLLIATTQHNPLLSASSSKINNNNVILGHASKAAVKEERGHGRGAMAAMSYLPLLNQQQQQSMPVYNMTASIDDVLAAQRARISLEMQDFAYDGGELMPKRSLIVTTWRSGSTFLGDILNAMPGNYYHYEPLLDFGIRRVRQNGNTAIHNLRNLLHCNYTRMRNYLNYGKEHTYLFEHNQRLWNVCNEFPHYCWQSKFLTQFCKLFPLQSMKTVRLSLSLAQNLLQDKSLNVRVVLLVRDPRGTMQSRKHRTWCARNADCEEPRLLCNDLVDDYHIARKLLLTYPHNFRTLRYEDLSLHPYEVSQQILQFYGLPFHERVVEFLNTHTKVNIGGVSSTYRDSKSAPFHWKMDLKVNEIRSIEKHCTEAMKLWGYRLIDNYTNFQNNFDPIILPAPFT